MGRRASGFLTWRARPARTNSLGETAAVAVKIKLKRLGKIRAPYYRIVVADSRTKRDGRAIEEIGKYHPKAEPSFIEVDTERVQHWLSVGAQPTDPVRKIFEITGDWQKFKGLPGSEGTLRTAEPKPDRKAAYAAAVAETLSDTEAKPKSRTATRPSRAKKADAEETKPAETKPAQPKPAKAKPAEATADEATAAKATVADTAAPETAPAEAAAAEATAAETTTAETAPAEAPPEATPAEETAPEDSTPAEATAEETADGAAEADGGS
jgi:small subunit ribosomal protein S16